MATSLMKGFSTSHMFGISVNGQPYGDRVKDRVRDFLHPSVRAVWVDEVSFLTKEHLGQMSLNAIEQRTRAVRTLPEGASKPAAQPVLDTSLPFGGLHTVFGGDLYQHDPVNAAPIYRPVAETASAILKKTATTSSRTVTARSVGCDLWNSIDTVFILRQVHRQHGLDAGVQKLKDYIQLFMGTSETGASRQKVEQFVDDLNSRAISGGMQQFASENPRIVVQRHVVGNYWNRHMIFMMAALSKKRLIVWSSNHHFKKGRPPPDVEAAILTAPGKSNTNLEPYSFYFDGIQLAFTDNKLPEVSEHSAWELHFLHFWTTTIGTSSHQAPITTGYWPICLELHCLHA